MADREVQRRLAAILAADVAGYTRLMEEDSDGTVAAWQDAREDIIKPKVREFSGKIVKLTGDGFLVEFRTVQDAVNCAIAMQSGLALSSLDFRIGVNLGDIIDDGEDIHGEGVNVAARIEALADVGGISISGGVYDQVRNRIKVTYEDRGEQEVKNVSAPVRVYAIRLNSDPSVVSHTDAVLQRPAIAVLPFDNMSGDPAQEYFSDGLTEDIITALSIWRSFPVISRNSTFAYKGKQMDVRDIARELDAGFILEGSVRKSDDRVRVAVQLIDAVTGHHLWAKTLDRNLEDLFELQDELTRQIVATIMPELDRAEAKRSGELTPTNINAWDYVHRGWSLLYQYMKEGYAPARELFLQAIVLDPENCRAYTGIAYSHIVDALVGTGGVSDEVKAEMLSAGKRAVELDDADSRAHNALGIAYLRTGQHDLALAEQRRAEDLNPSDSSAQIALGEILALVGSPEEGIRNLENGLRLNPQDPRIWAYYEMTARAYLAAHRYEEAVEWAQKAIERQADGSRAHLYQAVALGHLGRLEEARTALETSKAIEPYVLNDLERMRPYKHPVDHDSFIDGLRKAGWSEG